MQKKVCIMWFRHDLRLHDNPALQHALMHEYILPIHILDHDNAGQWQLGQSSSWWLSQSLQSLSQALIQHNHELHTFTGKTKEILQHIITYIQQQYPDVHISLTWNKCYEPYNRTLDKEILDTFPDINIKHFNGNLLFDPDAIRTQQGNYFQIFTPFFKHCLTQKPATLITSEQSLHQAHTLSMNLQDLPQQQYLSASEESERKSSLWRPGESFALNKFEDFLSQTLHAYKDSRNNLYDAKGTSLLSPHLHFGEISPRYLWYKAQVLLNTREHYKIYSADSVNVNSTHGIDSEHIQCFLSEICWREFSYHLLYHLPHIITEPIKTAFKSFQWTIEYHQQSQITQNNKQSQITLEHFVAWKHGKTGIPIVDAGMRELMQTGYMHNRARMICASFLTKNLLIPWQYGAEWFWDKLLDADLANNSCSWQWVAGCGVDAAPYFRIFNPILQSEKFDPKGEYIRKWIPELYKLSDSAIHQPWRATTVELMRADIILGKTYPLPIVDLKTTREHALHRYKMINRNV